VEEAELGVEEVVVEDEATPVVFLQAWSALAVEDAEGRAGFQDGEDANQALGDVVALGEVLGVFVLAGAAVAVEERASGLFGELLGMVLEALGLLGREGLEVLEEDVLVLEEVFPALGIAEGEVALEDEAVEAGPSASDFVSMLV
jgi:hypothetical protein